MANKEPEERELRESHSHVKLKNARLKYNELYSFCSFSRVGYMAIDNDGYITETNLKAAHLLEMNRLDLLNRKFSLFDPF